MERQVRLFGGEAGRQRRELPQRDLRLAHHRHRRHELLDRRADVEQHDDEAAGGPRPYAAGTWGPSASSAMIARDGYCWSEEC